MVPARAASCYWRGPRRIAGASLAVAPATRGAPPPGRRAGAGAQPVSAPGGDPGGARRGADQRRAGGAPKASAFETSAKKVTPRRSRGGGDHRSVASTGKEVRDHLFHVVRKAPGPAPNGLACRAEAPWCLGAPPGAIRLLRTEQSDCGQCRWREMGVTVTKMYFVAGLFPLLRHNSEGSISPRSQGCRSHPRRSGGR